MTRGKRAADNTTRGLSSRRQKMVEPAHAGVRQCRRRRVSVAVTPGEGGVGTHRRQSRRAIYNDDEDAASKNNGDHDVVFLATVAVGVLDVVYGGDGGGDSGGGSWLQFVIGRGVPEEEDQMTAWRAEPATGQGGRCLSDVAGGGGNRELIVTGIIRLCR
jgi:hypothetical protein